MAPGQDNGTKRVECEANNMDMSLSDCADDPKFTGTDNRSKDAEMNSDLDRSSSDTVCSGLTNTRHTDHVKSVTTSPTSEIRDSVKPATGPRLDDYGFLCNDEQSENARCHSYFRGVECDELLEEKWRTLLAEDQWQKHSSGKIRSYIQKGVPHTCRGKLWVNLLDVEMLAMKANFSYKANLVSMREQLVELGICEFQFAESLNVLGNLREDLPLDGQEHNSTSHFIQPVTLRQIFCDIERTYPNHEMFSSLCEGGQEGCAALFRVLAVYARYNKKVGYCQGMSYIAGLLLMQMSEAEAFWCLVALFERPKYLYGFYDDSLGKMKNYAAVFKKLLTHRLPVLTKHLRCLELQPLMFLTPWFMCLFAELPCWDTVLFIWDLFLLDGVSTMFRVALALMEVLETEMLACQDLSTLLPELLHVSPHVCNYETFVPVIWRTHIEPWEVKSLLAVVTEEEVIRQKRKRILSGETPDDRDGDAKRPRMQTEAASSPSIFRRFINFVTGKSGSGQRPMKKTHTQRLFQKAHTERTSRRKYLQSVTSTLSSEEFGGTPKTPSDENALHTRAREEFTFKMFNTPAPLRKSEGRRLVLPLATVNSPEIELQPMSRHSNTSTTDDSEQS